MIFTVWNEYEANLKTIWNLKVQSEIWRVNLNQYEPILNLIFLRFFRLPVWNEFKSYLKPIWNRKSQSETELKFSFIFFPIIFSIGYSFRFCKIDFCLEFSFWLTFHISDWLQIAFKFISDYQSEMNLKAIW